MFLYVYCVKNIFISNVLDEQRLSDPQFEGVRGDFGERNRLLNARPLWFAALLSCGVASGVGLPSRAHCQEALTLQLEHFEPVADTTTNTLGVFGSSVLPHLHVNTLAMLHQVQAPLVFAPAEGNDPQPQVLVADQTRAEVGAAVGLFGLMSVDLVLPMVLAQEQGQELSPVGRPGVRTEGFQLQDLRVTPKVSLMDRRYLANFGLALAMPIYIPIGDEEQLNGEGSLRLDPRLIGDWRDGSYSVSFNLGYRLRRWSMAATAPLFLKGLTVQGSLFGSVPVSQRLFQNDTGSDQFFTSNPVEGLLGVRYETPWQFSVGVFGGGALTDGIGAASKRGIFTVAWTPPLPVDTDGDGGVDELDRCPELAEDFDGYADSDGCPDLDNDKDQIPDVEDECMRQAEDGDGFEDTDGCPDIDSHAPGYVEDPVTATGRVTVMSPALDLSKRSAGVATRPRPSASPSKQFSVQGADVLGPLDSFAELQVEPVRVPGREGDAVTDWALMTTPLMALGLGGNSEVNFDMPFFGGTGDASAIGDPRLSYKAMILDPTNRAIGFSLSAPLIVPLQESPFSNNTFDFSPTFILDIDTSPLKTRLNLSPGVFKRTTEDTFGGILRYGLSGRMAILEDRLNVGLELAGERAYEEFAQSEQDAIFSMNLAVEYFSSSDFSFNFGANLGLAPEQTLPVVGFYAGLSYTTEIADSDNDGVSDDLDQCIVEAEDLDQFEDTDGCPELDNDRDLINDVDDACPMQAEDLDNVQDGDGCPEVDFDGDSVLDEDDECPEVPGSAQAQGCPADTVDADDDAVPDGEDRCPEQAGVIQWQGCRDVRVEVFFGRGSATLLEKSFKTLDEMVTIINTNKTIGKVEIQGHTDDVGIAGENRALSQDRADAVRDYLIKQGVAADRLIAKGYGESRPAVPIKGLRSVKALRAARELNRRVLFVLID